MYDVHSTVLVDITSGTTITPPRTQILAGNLAGNAKWKGGASHAVLENTL